MSMNSFDYLVLQYSSHLLYSVSVTDQVEQDDIVPGLLTLPGGADLHSHPLVLNGSLILQVYNLKFLFVTSHLVKLLNM